MRRFALWWLLLLITGPLLAQEDALNLPAALYVLTNAGGIDRYGLGAEGISAVPLPAEVFVVDFGLAPDGAWLAYRDADESLALASIHGGAGVVVDAGGAGYPPVRGRGDTIAWSPTGDAIAVTTIAGVRVYLYNALGGGQTVVDLPQGEMIQVRWSPDGRYLAAQSVETAWWVYRRDGQGMTLVSAIPDATGAVWVGPAALAFTGAAGGLSLMDLADANRQSLLLDATWQYQRPLLLPDGRLAVFGRSLADSSVEPGRGRLVALSPGTTRTESLGEAALDLDNLDWAPGGAVMLAFEGGVFALVNPASGQGFTLPISGAVAYGWGPPPPARVDGLALPVDGFFRADDGSGVDQVWRLPADGAPSVPLTAEADGVSAYALAPDNRAIIYSSGARLLRLDLAGGDAVALASLSEAAPADPAFSPDGARVAYVDGGIRIIAVAGGESSLVLANEADRRYDAPHFAANIDALLVRIRAGDAHQPGVLDPTSGALTPIGAPGQSALWLRDGRILLYGADGVGGAAVVSVTALDAPIDLLPDLVRVGAARELPGGLVRIALTDRAFDGPPRLRAADMDPANGQLALIGGGAVAFMEAAQFSPDGRFAAGLAHQRADGRGPLLLREVATGSQVLLREPSLTQDFKWAQR